VLRWLLVLLAACGDNAAEPRLLVYARTLGHRHEDSIAAGSEVLPARLAERGIAVDFTEDPGAFMAQSLARYDAVFFMYTSGNDILDNDGKGALEAFVRSGGGWLGLHSASDTEYAWPFYAELVVGHFRQHPGIQPATVTIEAPNHPAMRGAPSPWDASDEWYDFDANPRDTSGVTILATVDEATYTGGTMGADHPIIWVQERLIGRVEFTSIGHGPERWQEPAFVEHIASGVRWVTGLAL